MQDPIDALERPSDGKRIYISHIHHALEFKLKLIYFDRRTYKDYSTVYYWICTYLYYTTACILMFLSIHIIEKAKMSNQDTYHIGLRHSKTLVHQGRNSRNKEHVVGVDV